MSIFHLHPSVVHFPIALLFVAGAAGLVVLYITPRADLRALTWWSMLLGWFAGFAAVFTGMWDQRGLAPDAPFRSVLNMHIGAGLGLLVVFGWILYQRWLFHGEKARRKRTQAGVDVDDLLLLPSARAWLTALLILGMLLVLLSGWNGGQLVHVWGVNVGGR